jgi:hypothetical protein
MSNFTAILLTLATLGLMVLCLGVFYTRAHLRMDEIVTGVVNGVPISTKYRWLMLLNDFLGYAITCVLLLSIFGFGYLRAAGVVGNPSVESVAFFCGTACAWGAVTVGVFSASLVFYMVSVLRETKRT